MAERSSGASSRRTGKGGRTTPKGGQHAPVGRPSSATDSGRYTPPIPKEQKVSPAWVPVLMFALLGLGGSAPLLGLTVAGNIFVHEPH